jgi:hypothetical protein
MHYRRSVQSLHRKDQRIAMGKAIIDIPIQRVAEMMGFPDSTQAVNAQYDIQSQILRLVVEGDHFSNVQEGEMIEPAVPLYRTMRVFDAWRQ